jgi:carbamoyltransferase
VLASWDYVQGIATSLRTVAEELPGSVFLLREAASPHMNPRHFVEALKTSWRLAGTLGQGRRVPVIGMRHHDNHAYWAYAVSPFAGREANTMIVVMDGFGDDAAMSLFVAAGDQVRRLGHAPALFDSLGLLYSVISSTQGGWTTLSSEGRFMGAAAWGDSNRSTNPYYRELRRIIRLDPDGQVRVNRAMINYHKRGQDGPYGRELTTILGQPIPTERMWNPDAVLDVHDIEHSPMTRERVDKAAALQMVFEDALFHVVDGMIGTTRAHQLVLCGGTALNCIANMRLLEHFDAAYFDRKLGQPHTRLQLWVPPNPSDTGTAMGAAYQFAISHGAPFGPRMTHAFLCGSSPSSAAIEQAIRRDDEVASRKLGNVRDPSALARIADLVASIIADDGVVALYQGVGETGPRALGHRSILANPCNPLTRDVLNARVKYRELLRPLAPMVTREEAERLFVLSEGAAADDYNAYNYMVLTAQAKPRAQRLVPAVVHRDGTSRIQIVRQAADPVSHAILKALGRHLGVEAAVNTSLNVGSPIVQHPDQAILALKRSRGMTALVMIGDDGAASMVWHRAIDPPKDGGALVKRWLQRWETKRMPDAAQMADPMRVSTCSERRTA